MLRQKNTHPLDKDTGKGRESEMAQIAINDEHSVSLLFLVFALIVP